jgi:hypothetical protein
MKKKLFVVLAAAFALCACQGNLFGPDEVSTDKGPIRFKIAANNMTKAYTSVWAPGDMEMPIVASFYNVDGEPINPSVVHVDGGIAPKRSKLVKVGDYYYLEDHTDLVFPLGDVRMDALAFGYNPASKDMSDQYLIDYTQLEFRSLEEFGTLDDATDVLTLNNNVFLNARATGDWSSSDDFGWNKPVFSDRENYAKKVEFLNIDTWEKGVDLLYASANSMSAHHPVGELRFKHATTAVVFNIRVRKTAEGVKLHNLLFIDPDMTLTENDSAPNAVTLKDGIIADPDSFVGTYLSAYRDSMITVKSCGNLIIDNTFNKCVAHWNVFEPTDSYLENYRDNAKLNFYLRGYDYDEKLNQFASEAFSSDWAGASSKLYDSGVNDLPQFNSFKQWGKVLYLPPQEASNPCILYSINGTNYLYELNLPRTIWRAGHAYIYNLTLDFSKPSFNVTVEPWVGYLYGYDWNYLEGNYYWTSTDERPTP